jgi:glycosyltransferase involved in cell wall biosynthesis
LSVIDQDYRPLEIIIVDDGSNDKTKNIVDKIKCQYPNFFLTYFFQEKKGIAFARNKCVELALGEYIAWLDSDDYYLPNKLSLQMEYLKIHEKENCKIVFTRFQNFFDFSNDNNKKKIDEKIFVLENSYKYYLSTSLMKKENYLRIRFDQNLILGSDTKFKEELQKRGINLHHCLKKVLYKRRIHENNSIFLYAKKLTKIYEINKTKN